MNTVAPTSAEFDLSPGLPITVLCTVPVPVPVDDLGLDVDALATTA